MKKVKLFLFAISLIAFSSAFSQTTISMGEGYADDVYYSMKDGVTGIADRAEWDLGFYTSPESAGIITNGGSGIELRLYPNGDTTDWLNIDTNGMVAGWPILYNGEDSWENGAFNRNSGAYPDYGWGVYNPQSDNVVGDSIYIIKLLDGSYKKVWIVEKILSENKYIIRYANLDNSQDRVKILENNNFIGMNFSYFDFADESFFDREPATEDWDILFTKYQAMQPQGVPYPVVGVLNNVTTKVNRFHPVTLDFNQWYEKPLDTVKAVIGFDWKYFNLGLFQWTVEDSLLYFVNPDEGDIYKLYFTYFGGTANGDILFEDEIVSVVNLGDMLVEEAALQLSPNPASSFVNLNWNIDLGQDLSIHVYDLSGKEVLYEVVNTAGQTQHRLNVNDLRKGMYLVNIVSGPQVINKKLVIE